ncbi:MAG TPA: hypothetical protein VH062_01855 [Polyangiaceae bacterium]|nr:hypothetical protein [Polyangiaceae bacterium]
MKALSVRQPWPWAILYANKRHENRDWERCPSWMREFRGRVLLHASKGCTLREYGDAAAFIFDVCGLEVPPLEELPRGAIVGAMTIVDFVTEASSPWFMGPGALVLEDVKPAPKIVPCLGAQGFFNVPADVAAQLRGGS